ncbi:MAG: carbohydrate deacetylase [Phycisphaerae bacterium]
MFPRVTANADDFGIGPEVNRAIVSAVKTGWVSTTTAMANMPGFEEACELARQDGFVERVGAHLNVIEGSPLTDGIRFCELFCDSDGRFCLSRSRRVMRLCRDQEDALAEELHAQVARCRALGLLPRHADSHRHAHEEWGILSVAVRVCRAEGIGRLRIARNMGRSTGLVRTLYRAAVNHRIRRAGLAASDLFGSAADYEYYVSRGGRSGTNIEVMVHPVWDAAGTLIDATTGKRLSDMPWARPLAAGEERR